MTTLIVGGAGFIGPKVVRKLASLGEDVVCMDINPGVPQLSGLPSTVKVIYGDVTRAEDVMRALVESKANRLLNLAYRIGGESEPHQAIRLNVLGMENCLEAARLCGVKRFVYASSLAVYGKQKNFGERPVTEDDTLYPETVYSTCKRFNEFQAKQFEEIYGLSTTSIRISNVTGPDKVRGSTDHVTCITKPARGEPVHFQTTGTMFLPIHVDDVAEVFSRVLLADKTKYQVYNSGGYSTSIGDLAAMVRRFLPDAQITFGGDGGREDSRNVYLMDNTRLVEEFGIAYPPFQQRVLEIINEVRSAEGKAPVLA